LVLRFELAHPLHGAVVDEFDRRDRDDKERGVYRETREA